jgi:hypothetical protein
MKKTKLSIVEKKVLRILAAFLIIQFGIVLLICMGKPVAIENTKQVDIIVEDFHVVGTYNARHHGRELIIESDSTEYRFGDRATLKEYSVLQISQTISVGDRLTVRYYERTGIWGTRNWVVDARSEMEVFRSWEEYNNGGFWATLILFCIIELLLVVTFFSFLGVNKNTLKSIYRKIKKLSMKHNTNQ